MKTVWQFCYKISMKNPTLLFLFICAIAPISLFAGEYKTYINKNNGYTFKYPINFIVVDNSNVDDVENILNSGTIFLVHKNKDYSILLKFSDRTETRVRDDYKTLANMLGDNMFFEERKLDNSDVPLFIIRFVERNKALKDTYTVVYQHSDGRNIIISATFPEEGIDNYFRDAYMLMVNSFKEIK